MKNKKEKKKTEFSKKLLIQESVLIWIVTLTILVFAFISIYSGSYGDLPWLSTMIALPWGAYGVSQAYYYKKSMKENTKDGIKYESVMMQLQTPEQIEEDTEIEYEEQPPL